MNAGLENAVDGSAHWGGSVRTMDLKGAQRETHQWISQFVEGYWQPLSMMARLTEEVGELAREVNHRYGEKPKKPEEPGGDLALEMADIIFIVCAFANSLEIDLDDAFDKVMRKYRSRDKDRWTPGEESDEGSL